MQSDELGYLSCAATTAAEAAATAAAKAATAAASADRSAAAFLRAGHRRVHGYAHTAV